MIYLKLKLEPYVYPKVSKGRVFPAASPSGVSGYHLGTHPGSVSEWRSPLTAGAVNER